MFGKIAIVCLGALVAMPVQAQGAFDMGVLTGTVSQDATTQSEARRAQRGGGKMRARRGGRMRGLCAQRFSYPASARASRDGRAVERMCRARGF